MEAKKLRVNIFSVRSLEELKSDLKTYRDSLDVRCMNFVNDLLAVGIECAERLVSETDGEPYGTHKMGRYVEFTKQDAELTELGCKGLMIAKGQTLQSEWFKTVDGKRAEKVQGSINALLAVEFGTAIYSIKGSSAQHASESDWYFARSVDEDGKPTNWQHATAITPTRPMHNAFLEMEKQIEEAARRNF